MSAFIVKFKFVKRRLALTNRSTRSLANLLLVVVENLGAEEGDLLFLGLASGYHLGGQIQ